MKKLTFFEKERNKLKQIEPYNLIQQQSAVQCIINFSLIFLYRRSVGATVYSKKV